MSSTRPPDDSDAGLDRLLGQARWPEPTGDQLARLRRGWHSSRGWRGRRRRTYWFAAISAAASLLFVAGLLARRAPHAPDEPIVAQHDDDSPAVVRNQNVAGQERASERLQGAVNEPPLVQEPSHLADDRQAIVSRPRDNFRGQAPTLYEQVLLASRKPPRPATARPKKPLRSHVARQSPRRSPTAQAAARERHPLAERSGSPPNRSLPALVAVVRHAAAMARDPDRAEPLLWTSIRDNTGFARAGAADLLSRVATERSLPVLAELLTMPETHAAAILGLARLAAATDVAYLAAREPDAGLRRVLFAGLAARGTEQSVGLYLDFVARAELRREALDALADVPLPPSEVLLAYLRSPLGRERLAAAQALGRVSDPAVAQALGQSLAEPSSRQDAIIALLLNPTPQAAGVVGEARADPYLVASVHAAEFEINHWDIFPKR